MLLDADALESFLNCDGSDLLHFVSQGHVPAPVVLSDRLVRWTQPSIDAWVATGCPQGPAIAEGWYAILRDLIWAERAARKCNEQRRRAAVIRKRPAPVVTGPAASTKPRADVSARGEPEYV